MNRQDKTLLLLGILKSHQSHGYELHALLSSPLAPIHIGKANAYQILDQLEERGWVTGSEEREGNRPPRRVYSLTSMGDEVFERLLRERLAVHTPAVHADTVSLNFLALLPTAEAVELLSQRLASVQERLLQLAEHAEEEVGAHYGVDYMLDHVQFEQEWLAKLIDKLAAQAQGLGNGNPAIPDQPNEETRP